MKTESAVAFYGTKKKIADVCGIQKSSVSSWGEYVPKLRAYQLEEASGGKLKRDYPKAS